MKKFIIEYIILPAIMAGPFFLLAVITYDSYQHSAALKEVCSILGGVYVDDEICIEGKNLFGGK